MSPVGKAAVQAEAISDLYLLDPNPQGNPAVLLLHALGADCETWLLQSLALSEAGMRPLIPDLPGFGRSYMPPGARWSIAWAAKQVKLLLERLGLSPIAVVGLSLGGTVALRLALDAPERVGRLVIANSFAALRPVRWKEWFYLSGRFVTANLRGVKYQAQRVAWRVFPGADQALLRAILIQKILAADPQAYRAAMRSLALFDVRRRLREIRVPTLIISGSNDTTVPLANQAVLARGIYGARQVVIPGAGHGVSIDQPAAFNAAMLEFLRE